VNLPRKKVIPTLTEYSRTYLELYKNVKENTRIMKKSITTSLVKYLGDYSMDKITPLIIEKYRLERKEKDGVKKSSINVDIAILGHVFNTAIKSDIMDKYPCSQVKRLRVTQTRDRVLTAEEIALLFDRLQGKDRLLILVGVFTGVLLGEVLRLKWTDIDFDKGLLSFVQGKTGKLITIPFSSYLAGELSSYKEVNPGGKIYESREITNDIVIRQSEHFSKLFKSLGMLQKYSHTGLDSKRHAIEMLISHVLRASEKATIPMVSKTGTA
jgi:integrase